MLVIYLIIAVALIIFFTARLEIHPFIVLLVVALGYGFAAGMPVDQIIASVNQGFGNTLGGIGLIIVLGVIIGAFLENSGGAYVLARKILHMVGRSNVPPAMGIMGYVTSVPVFADSGFMLLSPLNRSLCKEAGLSLAGGAIALSLGLTASHTMVPPTPGPIATAGILGADLGYVFMVGIPVSLIAVGVSILYATVLLRNIRIEPAPELGAGDIERLTAAGPRALHSTLPILIPILLIVAKSVARAAGLEEGAVLSVILFLGEPFVALLVGVFLAFTLPRRFERLMFAGDGWIGRALAGAASILLITGAGGIFGKVLQNSGIADELGGVLSGWNIGIWLPFLLAAAIKTAQGSSTVAMITTASILSPMLGTLGFDTELEKALFVIAIGAGSAVVSHANDSFFWVVTQMSGMSVRTGYRTHTLGTLIMGCSAAACVYIIHVIFV
jgi:gluconate:H+ symporter, GntP family